MNVALTIAGSDSSCGAGIQADLKTFHAHGVYGICAVTAVTVQNTQKVYSAYDMPPKILHDQIICLFKDIEIQAVKIGMVSSTILIQAIADALKKVNPPAIVLDPVMISKSGYSLLKPDAQKALVHKLFPLAEVVTPNIYEAEMLTGKSIKNIDQMKAAACDILKTGAKKVIIKGGHMGQNQAIDILYDGVKHTELAGQWVKTKNTHGTGCTFSSAIAANIALGKDFIKAVVDAKTYITGAIKHSLSIGKGRGPTNHFFNYTAKH